MASEHCGAALVGTVSVVVPGVLVRAMIEQRQGRGDEARKTLESAVALSSELSRDSPLPVNLPNWTANWVLRSEAETRVLYGPGFPEDSFAP